MATDWPESPAAVALLAKSQDELVRLLAVCVAVTVDLVTPRATRQQPGEELTQAVSMAFKKALIERALGAELSQRLDCRPGPAKPEDASNHPNGGTAKTVLTEDGPVRIEVPRDHEGSFELLLIPKPRNDGRGGA